MRPVLHLGALAAAAAAAGDAGSFSVSNVFGDHMVLQRDRPITVWGFGSAGASVNGSIVGGSGFQCSDVGKDTIWRCAVPSTPAGGPYNLSFAQSDGQTASIGDALFGDVYLIGGQSNAVFSVRQAFNASEEIADATAANYPTMRLFTVGHDKDTTGKPATSLSGIQQPWTPVSPQAVAGPNEDFGYFSAVGWFFGRDLYKRLGGSVPIGLVSNNVGELCISTGLQEANRA